MHGLLVLQHGSLSSKGISHGYKTNRVFLFVIHSLIDLVCFETESLCSPGCSRACCIGPASFELRDSSASASPGSGN